jgi:ketosteroid isomerase-like protein
MTINSSVSARDRATVEQYLAYMQAGPGGVEDLVNLFDDDAVYVEPFAGQPQVHTGKSEIRSFFAQALEQNMRNARLTLDRLDIDGDRLRSEWTCHLPAMNAPLRGFDMLKLRDGRIMRLETTVTDFPGGGAS